MNLLRSILVVFLKTKQKRKTPKTPESPKSPK